MTARRPARDLRAALCAFLVLTLAAPLADAGHMPGAPADFSNTRATGFGAVEMPPYMPGTDGSVPIVARFVLNSSALSNHSAAVPAALLMLAFNVHTHAVQVDLRSVEDDKGRPLTLARDERSTTALQTRVFVDPATLDLNRTNLTIVLRGIATARSPGQFHLGAIAIAFDAGWGTVTTPAGDLAEVYGFTLLGVDDVATAGMAPPFEGGGNSNLLLAVPVAAFFLLVMAGWALLRGRYGTGAGGASKKRAKGAKT